MTSVVGHAGLSLWTGILFVASILKNKLPEELNREEFCGEVVAGGEVVSGRGAVRAGMCGIFITFCG